MTNEKITGQIVYMYAFDIAYDMKRQPLENLLGCPAADYSLSITKRSPKQLFFYRPQLFRLEAKNCRLNGSIIKVQRSIKVFNVGAISVQFRIPFEVEKLEDLVAFHSIKLDNLTIEEQLTNLAQEAFEQLKPNCIKPADNLKQAEDYTVFCIEHFAGGSPTEDWLKKNQHIVAGILTEEQDCENLSQQEASESTQQYISYYKNDLAVVDWDAALVIGESQSLNEIIHIMELANVQLVELEAYDRILDNSLETAYRDLSIRKNVSRQLQQKLREIRIDTARLSDELANTIKFLGDWYLAAVYSKISSRFHFADWNGIIKEKLKTLADLYQMLQQDWTNYLMMWLEIAIVLLFVIDLVILVVTAK
jgi:hypothetical protein